MGATFSCERPYSFYFDLIDRVFRTPDASRAPLHRLCTLARKQGARSVILEPAGARPHIHEEITDLDRMHTGGGGAAEAIAISFFACEIADNDDLSEVEETQFLGQAIVINYRPPGSSDFTVSYVFEAFLEPPALARENGETLLLNNYLAPHVDTVCTVRDRQFKVCGVYYCQQNSKTHVCAHACLRMAIRSADGGELSPGAINRQLQITPPCEGLSLGHIVEMIEHCGLQAEVADCDQLTHAQRLALLASIVESGDQALLVFKTGEQRDGLPEEHVVLVFGHTRHSDEWHPQALSLYGGPGSAKYLSASAWIDHFLIHDDNLGPYYTLGSYALESDPDVRAHWIIAVRRWTPTLTANGAEGITAAILTNILPMLATSAQGRWFDYLTKKSWRYVLRPILIDRDDYLEHLREAEGHDDTRMTAEEIARFKALPERLWMVEFSLPALFTGNRAKLGEVLLNACPDEPLDKDPETVLAGLRLPHLMLVRTAQGEMVQTPSSLLSHSVLYRRTRCGLEW